MNTKELSLIKGVFTKKALTTLEERVSFAYEKLKNRELKPYEIKELTSFILEPFSLNTKKKFFPLLHELFNKKISINQILSEIHKHENSLVKAKTPKVIEDFIKEVEQGKIKIEDKEIKKMFLKCFSDSIKKSLYKAGDGTYYLITGDIRAMWLRDSSLQIHCYSKFLFDDEVRAIFKGLLKRMAKSLIKDPYAYAFFEDYSIRRRKYELDSPTYFIWLLNEYLTKTNDFSIFDLTIKKALDSIISLLEIEQNHEKLSSYNQMNYFSPNDRVRDLLKNPNPSSYTGMIWNAFRPSDDPCFYNFHIPSNIFALKALEYIEYFYKNIYRDKEKYSKSLKIKKELRKGIEKHAIINGIFAYEVDGRGNYLLMDDANLPSLLSIPYFNPDFKNKTYSKTRDFILSEENPYFVKGKYLQGIGSPHRKGVWALSIIMQALTDEGDLDFCLELLKKSHANTYLIHEAINPDNPKEYTRDWFSMGNSMFAELILTKVIEK